MRVLRPENRFPLPAAQNKTTTRKKARVHPPSPFSVAVTAMTHVTFRSPLAALISALCDNRVTPCASVHHRLRAGQARRGIGRAQARQDRPAGRHPRGRGLAPAGLFQAPACRRARLKKASATCICRSSARRRKAGRPRAPATTTGSGRIYDKHIQKPEAQEALDELLALIKSGKRIALLCYCRDPKACHRCASWRR